MAVDIPGQALLDYLGRPKPMKIKTEMQYPGSEVPVRDAMEVSYWFRDFKEMPAIEQHALQLCQGEVLDLGSGAGSHGLYLQGKGLEVTAVDTSAGAVACCRQRGLRNVVQSDLYQLSGMQFDTILVMMNGVGLAGSLGNIGLYLSKLKTLLRPGGQVLIDSSDIIYMYPEAGDGSFLVPAGEKYYGEVSFRMSYGGKWGDWFPWLYLDFNSLARAAADQGLECSLESLGPHYDYLASLTINSTIL